MLRSVGGKDATFLECESYLANSGCSKVSTEVAASDGSSSETAATAAAAATAIQGVLAQCWAFALQHVGMVLVVQSKRQSWCLYVMLRESLYSATDPAISTSSQ